ncbi:MAG: hypothetical protein HY537_11900 [Deltaproteobacteria bacterium]|nr:hypothetical protein [Deltaproteobacteria bacterium]
MAQAVGIGLLLLTSYNLLADDNIIYLRWVSKAPGVAALRIQADDSSKPKKVRICYGLSEAEYDRAGIHYRGTRFVICGADNYGRCPAEPTDCATHPGRGSLEDAPIAEEETGAISRARPDRCTEWVLRKFEPRFPDFRIRAKKGEALFAVPIALGNAYCEWPDEPRVREHVVACLTTNREITANECLEKNFSVINIAALKKAFATSRPDGRWHGAQPASSHTAGTQ